MYVALIHMHRERGGRPRIWCGHMVRPVITAAGRSRHLQLVMERAAGVMLGNLSVQRNSRSTIQPASFNQIMCFFYATSRGKELIEMLLSEVKAQIHQPPPQK